ncbi:hypothetical protein DVJ78_11740 [Humibacter sp. BT305]|nr:hypothetical protein DVJ78_11740 [Humibacter sp. BT305]
MRPERSTDAGCRGAPACAAASAVLASVVLLWTVLAVTGSPLAPQSVRIVALIGLAGVLMWVVGMVLTIADRRARPVVHGRSRRRGRATTWILVAVPFCLLFSLVVPLLGLLTTDISYWPL